MVIIHINPVNKSAAETKTKSVSAPQEEIPSSLCPKTLYLAQLKKKIAVRNDELYSLQVEVLQVAWNSGNGTPSLKQKQHHQRLVRRADALEAEVSDLFEQYQTARVQGPPQDHPLLVPLHEAKAKAEEAEQLAATKQQQEEAAAEEEASEVEESGSSSSEYEEELEVGDVVAVVAASDGEQDGFSVGEEGFVVWVDPSITYPYRVQSKSRPSAQHGYFKASALRVVDRIHWPSQHKVVMDDIDLEKGLAQASFREPAMAQRAKSFAAHTNPLAIC